MKQLFTKENVVWCVVRKVSSRKFIGEFWRPGRVHPSFTTGSMSRIAVLNLMEDLAQDYGLKLIPNPEEYMKLDTPTEE